MGLRNVFRACFTPAVMIGTLLVAGLLLVATFLFVNWTRPGPIPDEPGTAIVNVIQAPTETPAPIIPTALASQTPLPDEGGIYLDGSVQVTGTGGDGLRLRFSPGLNSNVRLLGAEGEIFQVMDGPEQVDGYTWWYLENPQDRTRRGWAVAEFLQPIQGQ